ncbi:MAG: hypothetical protein LQ340_004773 [Diploschistes diacapsis]|nr:MAG: hypothetical protein LQ340_004773 [Diploschistes diacapsis]
MTDAEDSHAPELATTNGIATPQQDAGTDYSSQELAEKPAEKSADDNAKSSTEPSRSKTMLIMLALMLAVFLAAIDISIVTTALPTITAYFQSESAYTWTGSAYLLATAPTTVVWGKVSDVFGRKPILLLANILFFVGSLIAALSINVTMLLFGRAIQGLGGGGLLVLVNICIGDLFSPRRRGAYYGMIGLVWAVAMSLGPIIGGAFTQRVSWRWCFWINLPFDGLAFIILVLFLDIKTPKTPFFEGIKAIDWVGALLSMGGTLMFLFGLSYGGEAYPWNSATVICLIIFGIICWILWFVWEAYLAKYPILPVRIFKQRSNVAALGACFIQSFVFIGANYYLPLYFQTVLGADPILSGVYLLPTALSLSVATVSTGFYMRASGQYLWPMWAGFFLQTLGYGLFINLGSTPDWAKIILFQIIGGLGVGPNFQAPLIALQSLIQPRDIATATAAFAFTRNLATSISVVIAQVIFQNEMTRRQGILTAAIGPQLSNEIGGGAAGANTQAIQSLPPAQRDVVHSVLADSLSYIWIMYTAFSAVGIFVSFLVTKNTLSKDHTETKTGLEAEKEARQERLLEEQAQKKAKNGTAEA